MIQISPNIFQNIIKPNVGFSVPVHIVNAITKSVEIRDVNALDTEFENLKNNYSHYRRLICPVKTDYHGTITLDAYTVYYLSRNLGIPWLAFRELSRHPMFQRISECINVLDLGSGTGAVSLGLLYLYNNINPFTNGKIKITAMDYYKEALLRQRKLINESGLKGDCKPVQTDLNNIKDFICKARLYAPFNYIFIANCLTELDTKIIDQLISQLPGLLSDDGAIIIAEAQRDYIKRIISSLAKRASDNNLNVYYPCPNYICNRDDVCWVWRDHDYAFPDIKIDGNPLLSEPREDLKLSWLILTKQKVSLYDVIKIPNSSVTFGPIAQERKCINGVNKYQLGICDGKAILEFKQNNIISKVYNRGSIVSLDATGNLNQYHELR